MRGPVRDVEEVDLDISMVNQLLVVGIPCHRELTGYFVQQQQECCQVDMCRNPRLGKGMEEYSTVRSAFGPGPAGRE